PSPGEGVRDLPHAGAARVRGGARRQAHWLSRDPRPPEGIAGGRGEVMRREDLRGAVVIVTGASAGIGRETALEFARHGANVVVAARRANRLEALAGEVRRIGAEALVVPADVARPEDIARIVQAALDRWGRIDVLVNNAGFGFSGTIE